MCNNMSEHAGSQEELLGVKKNQLAYNNPGNPVFIKLSSLTPQQFGGQVMFSKGCVNIVFMAVSFTHLVKSDWDVQIFFHSLFRNKNVDDFFFMFAIAVKAMKRIEEIRVRRQNQFILNR